MKVLLLLVVLVAAFEANCRVNTDGPDGPDLNNLLSELEKPQNNDVDHQMKQDVNEKNQIKLRGKAETRILKKLLENLKSMKDEQTRANSEIKMELQAIESHQDNITKMNKEMKMELQSMEDNQRNMTWKLNSLENVNSNQDSKLNDIIDSIGNISQNRECPRDMFLFGPSNGRQCFKYFTDSGRSWTAANQKCRAENLELAETNDPTSLRAYLVLNYNPTGSTYLGARGDGSSQRWLRSGAAISTTSQLWSPGYPGRYVTTADNLVLLTTQGHLDNYPTKPYFAYTGTYTRYTLCELVMN